MKNRFYSAIFGLLMGLSLSILGYVLFVEHMLIFFEFPIIPISGAIIGVALGWFRKLPAPKIWISVLCFAAIVSIAVVFYRLRDEYVRKQREAVATSIALIYPTAKVINMKYEKENGWDTPPNVNLTVEADDSYSDMINYMEQILEGDGWIQRWDMSNVVSSWESNWGECYFRNQENEIGKVGVYSVEVDFWSTFYGSKKSNRPVTTLP